MPIALLILGIVLVRTGYMGTTKQAWSLASTELFGDGTSGTGFIVWATCIALVGAVGVIKPLKGLSNGLLWLIFLSILLKNNNGLSKYFPGSTGTTTK